MKSFSLAVQHLPPESIAVIIGMVIGIVLHKHIPENTIEWGAAVTFMVFGLAGLHQNASPHILTPFVEGVTIVLLVAACLVLWKMSGKTPEDDEEPEEAV